MMKRLNLKNVEAGFLALLILLGAASAATAAGGKPVSFKTCRDFSVSGSFKDENERFKKLLALHWSYTMQTYPEWATYLGYQGQNDRWTDSSEAAIEKRKQELQCQIQFIKKINRKKLNSMQQVNFDLFLDRALREQEGSKFNSEYLEINQLDSIVSSLSDVLNVMPTRTALDYQNLLQRLQLAPQKIEQSLNLLKMGLKKGITPPQVVMAKVPGQFDQVVVEPIEKSPLYEKFLDIKVGSDLEKKALQAQAAKIISEQIYPRVREYKKFLVDEYIPHCRSTISIEALPQGQEWYLYAIRHSTTTDMTAEEIHNLGLKEVERIEKVMAEIRSELKFQGDSKAFNQFLIQDKKFYFETARELLAAYRDVAKQIDAELPRFFKVLPRLPYGVREIPAYKAGASSAAYYTSGSLEDGRAGFFEANTSSVGTRPKWAIEDLTLHEAVPGHHLQISLAQEMGEMPEFRKNSFYTAFTEGWGLYAESLGGQLGLYKDPYSKYGQLVAEIWRAARLVVDTGIHHKGWSREQAITYMLQHLAKSRGEIEVEVDRYIVWPGQALAYKIGELKFLQLRQMAEEKLKDRFDIRDFHQVVLGQGSLPLNILQKNVEQWIAERLKK